jgi:hypothetical protein
MELNAGLSAGTESSDAAGVSEDFEGSYPGGISGNTEVIEESGAGDEAMSGAWSESEAPAA